MKCAVILLAVSALAYRADAEDYRTPVIVELFTSEGCSSCPPADELLGRLERTQPVAAARIIALEEHVDYWNHLGWSDPFSARQFTARQNEYAHVFSTTDIFTPQMVVNGHAAFVGGDYATSNHAIEEEAAAAPLYRLRLSSGPSDRDRAMTDLQVVVRSARAGKPDRADVFLAITESRLSSNVARGENAGHLLRHAPVVRSFGVIGKIEKEPFNEVSMKSTLKIPTEWRRENLRAVVFVQDRTTHRITAAATTDLK